MPIIGHCWKKTKSDIVKTKKGMSPWLPNCYTQKNEYEEVIMEIFLLMMKNSVNTVRFGITSNAQN